MSQQERQPWRMTVDEFSIDADNRELASLVSDDGQVLVVPRIVLPAEARLNSIVNISFNVDGDETERRRRRIENLQRRLFGP
jgi:hypothetical protein